MTLCKGLGFGVWGLGFGVWGLGFGFWVLGFDVNRNYSCERDGCIAAARHCRQ